MSFNVMRKLNTFVVFQAIFMLCAFFAFRIICHLYIPNLSSLREVHLSFVASRNDGRVFATDEFSLSEFGSSFFTPGQNYRIEFLISIPDSPQNLHVGAYLVLPIYRPWLIDIMDTIIYAPLYFFNFCIKQQRLRVVFSNNYLDNLNFPTFSGQLVLETNGLRWYTATLIISAVLNPLLWIIYQHIWFVGLFFIIAVTLALDCLAFCLQLLRLYLHRTETRPLSSQAREVPTDIIKETECGGNEDTPPMETINPSAYQ